MTYEVPLKWWESLHYNAKLELCSADECGSCCARAIWDTVEACTKSHGTPGIALKQLQLFE